MRARTAAHEPHRPPAATAPRASHHRSFTPTAWPTGRPRASGRRGATGRSGPPAARTSTELRALLSSLRTSPPTTTWLARAPGCEPTTIRSTGSTRDSRSVAPSFAASAPAVSRATSFVGPAERYGDRSDGAVELGPQAGGGDGNRHRAAVEQVLSGRAGLDVTGSGPVVRAKHDHRRSLALGQPPQAGSGRGTDDDMASDLRVAQHSGASLEALFSVSAGPDLPGVGQIHGNGAHMRAPNVKPARAGVLPSASASS